FARSKKKAAHESEAAFFCSGRSVLTRFSGPSPNAQHSVCMTSNACTHSCCGHESSSSHEAKKRRPTKVRPLFSAPGGLCSQGSRGLVRKRFLPRAVQTAPALREPSAPADDYVFIRCAVL